MIVSKKLTLKTNGNGDTIDITPGVEHAIVEGNAAVENEARDLVKRMVKAFVEGIHIVRVNPEQAKRALAKYRKTNDEKQLEEAYQVLKEIVRPKPYPSAEGFKTILKDLGDRLPAAPVISKVTSAPSSASVLR